MPVKWNSERWQQNEDGSYSRYGTNPYEQDEDDDDEDGTPQATAAAINKAAELGVDLSSVTGTGLNGKITVPDVEAAASG